jgi:hypothetical protein
LYRRRKRIQKPTSAISTTIPVTIAINPSQGGSTRSASAIIATRNICSRS